MAIILKGASNSLWTSALSRRFRLLKPKICTQEAVRFASLGEPLPKNKPVQYSSSQASKITISEVFGFESKRKKISIVQRTALAIVLSGLIIYIFFFHTSEEFDEIFNLDQDSIKRSSELLDLKLKLKYCIKNNLPTDALIAKIDELEKDKAQPSPFRV